MIGVKVRRNVDEYLVYGVDVYILGSHIFQIYPVYPRAVGYIQRHAWRSHHVVQLQRRVCRKLLCTARLAAEFPVRSSVSSDSIDIPHLGDHLKKPRSAADAAGFQRRSHRKADSLFGSAPVRHHKICVERVEPVLHALHGSIE